MRRDELVARESPESPLGRPIEVAPVPAAHVRLQREVLRLNIRVVLVDALDLVLRGGGCRGRGAGRAHVGGEGAEALHQTLQWACSSVGGQRVGWFGVVGSEFFLLPAGGIHVTDELSAEATRS